MRAWCEVENRNPRCPMYSSVDFCAEVIVSHPSGNSLPSFLRAGGRHRGHMHRPDLQAGPTGQILT
ncbi:hypothetical protein FOA52_009082 [Chlamydomonas sp. UWO 241]|nr:hypothetical protein FOA52_009082 [Chlamydomonas sp. UWO 241]